MALYLTYRPKDFASLVGQGFIKETLQKAVEQDKTVGAYLFTWPRGTGKTSTARIFAKAINCENPQNGNPCWECIICKNFQENRLIDIIEIDAASYTGVDNIREIIEKAQFQPTQTKYKIYIIDEVHMLSKGAFNALLKILEEPPKHVKFILATTEIQKVPETILSRCQRYDFRSISDTDIRERLEYITAQEGIEVDEKSYDYIVKHAEGGMRNAISLFEQLIQDKKISFDYISQTLWVWSEEEKQSFQKKLLAKDISLLQDFENFVTEWKNLKNFFKEILTNILIQAQNELQAGKSITHFLETLEALQDVLMKTKNSFDETLTLKIGLLKILGGNLLLSQPFPKGEKGEEAKPQTNPAPKASPHPNPLPRREGTNAHLQPHLLPMGEELWWGLSRGEELWWGQSSQNEWGWEENPLLSVVTDIFSANTNAEIPGNKNIAVNSWFDTETYITQVKAQGAKAAVTMSLRGSDISLSGDTLRVNAKTTVSQNTLKSVDNQLFLLQAGEILGLWFQKIEIL